MLGIFIFIIIIVIIIKIEPRAELIHNIYIILINLRSGGPCSLFFWEMMCVFPEKRMPDCMLTSRVGGGGGGSSQKSSLRGGSALRSNPYPLLYTITTEKIPLSYTLY